VMCWVAPGLAGRVVNCLSHSEMAMKLVGL
jgi:hypothetical protein